MQQRYYLLVVMLHEGHQLCLSKLIIAQLYEEMRFVVNKLQNDNSINPGGPIWFLQLWANAIFEPYLTSSTPTNLSLDIDEPRLCYLHQDIPKSTPVIDEFYFFFKHLHQLSFSNTRGLNLSPCSDRTVCPS